MLDFVVCNVNYSSDYRKYEIKWNVIAQTGYVSISLSVSYNSPVQCLEYTMA